MIKIFVTGWTIDVDQIDWENYLFKETYIPDILKQWKSQLDIDIETLFLKDSIYTNDKDRNKIIEKSKNTLEEKIIITHGTDTIIETAKLLADKNIDKTIVLLWSIIPYKKTNSDASFNLASALIAVQTLSKWVYITMNWKIFSPYNVQKNKALGIFQELT